MKNFGLTFKTATPDTVALAHVDSSLIGTVAIPEMVDGKKVIAVLTDAFKDASGVDGVIVPYGITTVAGCFGDIKNIVIDRGNTKKRRETFKVRIPATATAMAFEVAGYKLLTNLEVAHAFVNMVNDAKKDKRRAEGIKQVVKNAKEYLQYFVTVAEENVYYKAANKTYMDINPRCIDVLVKGGILAVNDDEHVVDFLIRRGNTTQLKNALHKASFSDIRQRAACRGLADNWLFNEKDGIVVLAKTHAFIKDCIVAVANAWIEWLGDIPEFDYDYKERNRKNLPESGTSIEDRAAELDAVHGSFYEIDHADPIAAAQDEPVRLGDVYGYQNVPRISKFKDSEGNIVLANTWARIISRPFNYAQHVACVRVATQSNDLTPTQAGDYLIHMGNQIYVDAMASAEGLAEQLAESEVVSDGAGYITKLFNILRDNFADESEDAKSVYRWMKSYVMPTVEASIVSPNAVYETHYLAGGVELYKLTYKEVVDDLAAATSKAINNRRANRTMVEAILRNGMYGECKRRVDEEYESENTLTKDRLLELDLLLEDMKGKINAGKYVPKIREAHPDWSESKVIAEAKKMSAAAFNEAAQAEDKRRCADACVSDLLLSDIFKADSAEDSPRGWEEIIADPNDDFEDVESVNFSFDFDDM